MSNIEQYTRYAPLARKFEVKDLWWPVGGLAAGFILSFPAEHILKAHILLALICAVVGGVRAITRKRGFKGFLRSFIVDGLLGFGASLLFGLVFHFHAPADLFHLTVAGTGAVAGGGGVIKYRLFSRRSALNA